MLILYIIDVVLELISLHKFIKNISFFVKSTPCPIHEMEKPLK